MQCELSVLVNDRVSRIRTALKADDDVRLGGKHVCDLAFSFVAPVCSDNCLNHELCVLLMSDSASPLYPSRQVCENHPQKKNPRAILTRGILALTII